MTCVPHWEEPLTCVRDTHRVLGEASRGQCRHEKWGRSGGTEVWKEVSEGLFEEMIFEQALNDEREK